MSTQMIDNQQGKPTSIPRTTPGLTTTSPDRLIFD
jgi:hypothetical protein